MKTNSSAVPIRSSSQSSRAPSASSSAAGWPGPSGIAKVSLGSNSPAASSALIVRATRGSV